jgi:hypothetical protein
MRVTERKRELVGREDLTETSLSSTTCAMAEEWGRERGVGGERSWTGIHFQRSPAKGARLPILIRANANGGATQTRPNEPRKGNFFSSLCGTAGGCDRSLLTRERYEHEQRRRRPSPTTDDHRPPRPHAVCPPQRLRYRLFIPDPLSFTFSRTRPPPCASQTSPFLPRTGPRSAYPLNSTIGVVCFLPFFPTFFPYHSSDSSSSTSTRH